MYQFNESILDNITSDDISKRTSDVLSTVDEVNSLLSPQDACYQYLFKIGASYQIPVEITDEIADKLEYNRQFLFDVLYNCRQIKKYSDIEIDYKKRCYVWFVFSADLKFKRPSEILHFIDQLYIASIARSSKLYIDIQMPTWIRYCEFDKDQKEYNLEYENTFKEAQLLHRRLNREKNSFVSSPVFVELHSMICTLIGGRELTFPEFCNFKIALDGTYDIQETVLYMINRTTKPLSSIILPFIAKSEIKDKTVDFKNLVLKWTKSTSLFRIPTERNTKELPIGLLPCRGDCENRNIRDEICNSFEKNNNLKISGQPYIFTHYTEKGGLGVRLSIICHVQSNDSKYMTGFVVTVPINNNENEREVTSQVLAGILREGLSLDAKRAIEFK